VLFLSVGFCPASFQKDTGAFARELVQAVGGSAAAYDRALSANELREAHLLGAYAIEAAATYKRENGLSYFKSTDAEYADRFAGADAWRYFSFDDFKREYAPARVGEAGGASFGETVGVGVKLPWYMLVGVKDGAVGLAKGVPSLFEGDTWKAAYNMGPQALAEGAVVGAYGGLNDFSFNNEIYKLQGDYAGGLDYFAKGTASFAGGFLAGEGIAKVTGKVVQGAKAAAAAKLTKATSKSTGSGVVQTVGRFGGELPDTGKLVQLDEYLEHGVVVAKGAGFADDARLLSHFEKHGVEFGVKSADEYLQVGQDIMQQGQKVQYLYKGETRTGFVQYMGNSRKGISKFGFVGTNTDRVITTIHTESGNSFWKMLNGSSADKTIRQVP
jgi:hypothetical protein